MEYWRSVWNIIKGNKTSTWRGADGYARIKDGFHFHSMSLNAHEEVVSIVEKPEVPASNFAVTGVYCYPPDVFEIIRTLTPSERGEFEITDVNNWYLRQGRLEAAMLEGYWTDAGTFPSLARANELVRQSPPII